MIRYGGKVLEISGVGELIEIDDFEIAFALEGEADETGPDEASAAGDQYLHEAPIVAGGPIQLFELLSEFGELLLQSFHLGAQESDVGLKSGDSLLARGGFLTRGFLASLRGRWLSR
jgi:hypothetical protein